MDDNDDNTKKKMSNKKVSNFMNQRQSNKTKVDDTEGNTSDSEAESSDDDYRFAFL